MKKVETLLKMKEAGVVAVVRTQTKNAAILASRAIIDGGLTAIEITYTVPNAKEVIQQLREEYKERNEIIIGAGTVLEEITALEAIQAGAEFIVSPCFDESSARRCNLYQVPYLPGCLTPTEIKGALTLGVDIIKLFPGGSFSPNYIKNLKAPLPQVNIMPTGGVNLDNMAEWFEKGAVAVGVGGDLLKGVESENFNLITEKAAQYKEKYLEIRSQGKIR